MLKVLRGMVRWAGEFLHQTGQKEDTMTPETIRFAGQFLKDWRRTGSVFPSSRYLAQAMVETIDFRQARHIIELGPGTGVFTREILARMHPECILTVYELNKEFCAELATIKDKRLRIENTTAAKVQALRGTVDVVVSGLPLANFNRLAKLQILLGAKDALKVGGQFIQFQYTTEAYTLLRRVFGNVSRGFVLYNAPPAFVYRCRKG